MLEVKSCLPKVNTRKQISSHPTELGFHGYMKNKLYPGAFFFGAFMRFLPELARRC